MFIRTIQPFFTHPRNDINNLKHTPKSNTKMAKRKIRETICSFCIDSFPDSDVYTVVLPMHNLPDGTTRGEYYTPCCGKCINKNSTKERILRIKEEPKSNKTKK